MKHGITSESWEGYLENALAPDERDRIEAHLISCVSCWEFNERLATLTQRMQADGEILHRRFPLSDTKLQEGLRATYARICATRDAEQPANLVQKRLQEMEIVMTVFCGEKAAANALQAAAAHSPAKSLKQVTRENWEPFLQRLIAIAQVLCGRTGARWLLESGRI